MLKYTTSGIFAVLALLLAAGFSPVSADYKFVISDNGSRSDNTIRFDSNNDISVQQENNTNISNDVNVDASTEGNRVFGNTRGDVSIETGDASADVEITNNAGMNVANIGGQGGQDVTAVIEGNGYRSDNSLDLNFDNTTTVRQENHSNIDNNVDVNLETGDNRVGGYGSNFQKYDHPWKNYDGYNKSYDYDKDKFDHWMKDYDHKDYSDKDKNHDYGRKEYDHPKYAKYYDKKFDHKSYDYGKKFADYDKFVKKPYYHDNRYEHNKKNDYSYDHKNKYDYGKKDWKDYDKKYSNHDMKKHDYDKDYNKFAKYDHNRKDYNKKDYDHGKKSFTYGKFHPALMKNWKNYDHGKLAKYHDMYSPSNCLSDNKWSGTYNPWNKYDKWNNTGGDVSIRTGDANAQVTLDNTASRNFLFL